ncbi:ABC transporter substrate-binding protein [Ramlibacter sp. AW1]|uniref:ABC transporter substrate-binding protein n=1 Tax=Ramlibacter aurantiacus TaxID=2801330 RepID=A0A936ZP47_9BURK|nr:ABC transporter substrate-binding protein [Ramlibacter aurantiacus]MBL0420888.1 ABC transporter substrate-binding protein [Ramlibacter aurantiacus]
MKSTLTAIALATAALAAQAQDKVTFLTSWYAQAEHGGYYQAVANGIYKKHGLDVTVKMGGPQVNGVQLLAAGQADFLMGKDFQTLNGIQSGIPLVTVAAVFQFEPQGMVTHPDVKSLADLKGKTILMATSARTSWYPWLKAKYGLTDEQTRPYTFNMQPFFADKNTVQQGYPGSEPYTAQQAGQPVKFFLFADEGYPPYGNTIVAMQKIVKDKPDVVRRFVTATLEGWKSYLQDPAPGNALIKKDNPKMDDGTLAYSHKVMKDMKFFDGGDAARMGPGTMTDARWQKTYELMVQGELLKPMANWKDAYTLQFVKAAKP